MKARIYQDEHEQWIIADDDEEYVEGPIIDLPDELAEPMRTAQDQWQKASKLFSGWVERQIAANGGDDYRDYLTGVITESQWRARRDGCSHKATVTAHGRTECVDCGRRHYPERWL